MQNTSMCKPASLAGMLVMLFCCTGQAQADQAANTYALAERILGQLSDTRYTHRGQTGAAAQPDIVQQQDGSYRVVTDCSGWVSYVLSRTAPQSMNAIREFAQQLKDRQKWPQAYVYQQFFATLGNGTAQGWQGVRDLRELRAGDVVSWCLHQHCVNAPPDSAQAADTGHVMIAAGPLQPLDADALVQLQTLLQRKQSSLPPATAVVMQMPVIDASTLPHYADSSRSKMTGTSGLGRGNIYVALDEAGQALGIQFPGAAFRYTYRGPDGRQHTLHVNAARPFANTLGQ
ncbi:hypothetical protein [Undibacterium rugosum]|uniref:hypothetical protein n=1 Tax=Undibacterium rugosum TaxID=2762291 RepID=UPI001B81A7AB|nr:hypothetical protein [Undibacterium rugosum]MBR7779897.1 hypothetical protein [Undibacterium rugosum]